MLAVRQIGSPDGLFDSEKYCLSEGLYRCPAIAASSRSRPAFIVSGQPIVEIGLQFLDRAIELLAESDIVELVLESSAGMFSDAVGPRRIGPGVIHILDGQAELVGVILNLVHNIPLLRRSRVYSARPHQLRLSRRSKRQSSSRRRGGPPITGAEIRFFAPPTPVSRALAVLTVECVHPNPAAAYAGVGFPVSQLARVHCIRGARRQ